MRSQRFNAQLAKARSVVFTRRSNANVCRNSCSSKSIVSGRPRGKLRRDMIKLSILFFTAMSMLLGETPTSQPAATQPAVAHRYKITWRFGDGSEKWDPAIRQRIADAMNAAVELYNTEGEFEKTIIASYSPGTPTADGNYNGHIRFGGQISKRVALHEIAHTLGIGQYRTWRDDQGRQVDRRACAGAASRVRRSRRRPARRPSAFLALRFELRSRVERRERSTARKDGRGAARGHGDRERTHCLFPSRSFRTGYVRCSDDAPIIAFGNPALKGPASASIHPIPHRFTKAFANFPCGSHRCRNRANSIILGYFDWICSDRITNNFPQCGRGSNGEHGLDRGQHLLHGLPILLPRKMNRHAVALIARAQPQVIGGDRTDLGNLQDRCTRDRGSIRSRGSRRTHARGRRRILALQFLAGDGRVLEPKMRQPLVPRPGDAALRCAFIAGIVAIGCRSFVARIAPNWVRSSGSASIIRRFCHTWLIASFANR